jgi:hypothetical protein
MTDLVGAPTLDEHNLETQLKKPPNNRLKQTARGRSVAESLRRTRAAA